MFLFFINKWNKKACLCFFITSDRAMPVLAYQKTSTLTSLTSPSLKCSHITTLSAQTKQVGQQNIFVFTFIGYNDYLDIESAKC